MKKFIIILLMAMSLLPSYAQRYSFLSGNESIETAEEYFRNNAQYLKPIEGMYRITFSVNYAGGNMLTGLRKWGGDEHEHEHEYYGFIALKQSGNYVVGTEFADNVGIPTTFTLSQQNTSNFYYLTGSAIEEYTWGRRGSFTVKVNERVYIQGRTFNVSYQQNDSFHMIKVKLHFEKL